MSFQSKHKEVQNYTEIIQSYNAQNKFQDPEFPPTMDSIGGLDLFDTAGTEYQNAIARGWDGTIHWMRPEVFI